MSKIYATKNKIIIKPIEKQAELTTPNGIILTAPSKQNEIIKSGNVLEAGPDVIVPYGIQENDIVMYNVHCVNQIQYNGQELHIITEDDILCLIKE